MSVVVRRDNGEWGEEMELPDLIERAYEQTSEVMAGVRPDQMDLSTPCEEWNVRQLMNHMIGGVQMFAMGARGEEPDIEAVSGDLLGDDPSAAFADAVRTANESWHSDGALDQDMTIPAGTFPGFVAANICLFEAAVHGWDLAEATGQSMQVDPGVASTCLEFTSGFGEAQREGPFGPAVPAPDDASDTQRLVAWLGRQP